MPPTRYPRVCVALSGALAGFAALYAFASTGWLPTEAVPLLTAAGTRTLNGYLLAIHTGAERFTAGLVLALAGRLPSRAAAGSLDGATLLPLLLLPYVLLQTLLLTSAPLHFAMWPLLTPTWLEATLLRLARLGGERPAASPATPPVHARFGGWVAWAAAFVLFTCASNSLLRLNSNLVRCAGAPGV